MTIYDERTVPVYIDRARGGGGRLVEAKHPVCLIVFVAYRSADTVF